jgi:hypothetical protein
MKISLELFKPGAIINGEPTSVILSVMNVTAAKIKNTTRNILADYYEDSYYSEGYYGSSYYSKPAPNNSLGIEPASSEVAYYLICDKQIIQTSMPKDTDIYEVPVEAWVNLKDFYHLDEGLLMIDLTILFNKTIPNRETIYLNQLLILEQFKKKDGIKDVLVKTFIGNIDELQSTLESAPNVEHVSKLGTLIKPFTSVLTTCGFTLNQGVQVSLLKAVYLVSNIVKITKITHKFSSTGATITFNLVLHTPIGAIDPVRSKLQDILDKHDDSAFLLIEEEVQVAQGK